MEGLFLWLGMKCDRSFYMNFLAAIRLGSSNAPADVDLLPLLADIWDSFQSVTVDL
jgi:hypothetical protein